MSDKENSSENPRILLLDIETRPLAAFVWGLWDQTVGLSMINADWHILAFAAKWLGEDDIFYMDTRGKGEDDKEVLSAIWNLLNEADYVVGHNSAKFDLPKINARFVQNGMLPSSPVRHIDTLRIARSRFNFTSNKLEYLATALECSPKMTKRQFNGFSLWDECMKDNEEAWEEMRLYNEQDVIVLEEVFYKLRPWFSANLNYNLFISDDDSEQEICRTCGSDNLHKRGFSYTAQSKFQRYRCMDCGSWHRGTQSLKRSRLAGITE